MGKGSSKYETSFNDENTNINSAFSHDERENLNGLNHSFLAGRRVTLKHRTASMLDEIDTVAVSIDPNNYDFDFENLVFEGGGNKGLAYCGAIKYLQEVGIMRKIKRIAGASAGAMTAALVAVGYSPDEIEDFLGNNISDVFIDHSCGYFSLVPNLLSGYGWNPGKKIFKWFGEKFKNKTGKEDITFHEVYELIGMELCIVVTNISQMTTEYCHPKTTPDMPVRLAVRMSLAIPGMYAAIKYNANGQTDIYVDGGVLCNYPIHCFDGWFLSMAPGNGFFERLQPLDQLAVMYDRSERFREFNRKTLGFLLFADDERDVLQYNLEKRVGVLDPSGPSVSTKLYKKKYQQEEARYGIADEHGKVLKAVEMFLLLMKEKNIDNDDNITLSEFDAVFRDKRMTTSTIQDLFGKNVDMKTAFNILKKNKGDTIKYGDVMQFIESKGISLQLRFLGYKRNNVTSLVTFLDALQSTLLTNVKRIYVGKHDMDRTVGINTGHVGTTDFNCDEADRDFVVARGYNGTKAFLQYHVAHRMQSERL